MTTIQKLHLDENQMPEAIELTLTISEAAFVARLAGMQSHNTTVGMGIDPGAVSSVYASLIGTVFNRYWEDGLNGYLSGDES